MRKPNLKSDTAKRVALSGIMLAFALILSVVENLLPPIIPMLPYAKIGLTNIVLLACFMLVGVWEGYVVLLLKCVLAAVFAGNMSMLIWSLPSALVAYTVMVLLYKTKLFSTVGLSMAGGMLHNFTQILVATIVLGTSVFAYLPYMLLAGGIAGLATGIVCHFVLFAVNGAKKKTTEIFTEDAEAQANEVNPQTEQTDAQANEADSQTGNRTEIVEVNSDAPQERGVNSLGTINVKMADCVDMKTAPTESDAADSIMTEKQS